MLKFFKKYYSLLPLLLLCCLYIYKANYFAIHDFANYYFGAYFLKEGLFTTDIYFPYYFNATIANLGYQNIFVSYAPNTPFLSVLFYPFTYLPLSVSKLIFNILSSGLFLFSLVRLTNYFKLKKEYLLLLPFIFFIPLKNNLLFGQVYFLLFFFLSEGFLAYQKKHYKTMALFWTLAVFLKVFPIILGLFLLFKKEYKALKYFVIFCVVLLGLSIIINGIEVWKFYFVNVLSRASNGEIAGAYVDNYQSVYMFLKRIFVYDEIYNSNVLFNQPTVFKAILIFIKVLLIGIGLSFTIRNRKLLNTISSEVDKSQKSNLFIFSFWLLVSILLSPYGSTYTFILFIFLYVFSIVSFRHPKERISKYFLIITLFLIATNYTLFPLHNFPLNYLRLFLMILLTIFLVYKFKEQIKFKQIILLAFILTFGLFLLNNPKTSTSYLLNKKTPILTYNYQIKENKLSYFYFNENGEHKTETNLKIINFSDKDISIIKNQIYYKNKQLTFDNGNKLKPMWIDNKYIVFLSDKNRGIGFYELRKIIIDK